jgi:DNA-binding LacI/PurR family transcriptional regulator
LGIKELAKHLNISIGTVSRALNNHPEVNAETRKRVLEAAERYGYAPDQAGRSLRKGTINTVAFVLSTARTSKQDALFFMELCHGVQEALARHDLELVMHFDKPGDNLMNRVRRVVERRQADALILAETALDDARIEYLSDRGFPFATLGRSRSGTQHPWIDLDFESAMRQAMERLVAFGHRRIALTTGKPELMLDRVLADAYKTELARHGLPYDPDLDRASDPDENGGYGATHWYLNLKDRPTAILFPHYRAVSGSYLRLQEAGLVPGKDIAVVSCSADTAMAQYLSPALTCFGIDFEKLGMRLGEALLSAMPRFADDYGGAMIQENWPWTIVPRESDAFRLG